MYYRARARRVTPRNLLLSVGLVSLSAGLIGGMPLCHGSGGVTAHYRLGARTGGANLMIGGLLLFLALLLGGKALPYLMLVPYPVLGVLLGFVGLQHSFLAKNIRGAQEIAVAALIGLVTLYTGNLAVGFGLGIALHYAIRLLGYCFQRRREA
jgi:SulP family sulfate permease